MYKFVNIKRIDTFIYSIDNITYLLYNKDNFIVEIAVWLLVSLYVKHPQNISWLLYEIHIKEMNLNKLIVDEIEK